MSETELRRTPLFEKHVSLGGKMVPFAGWEMPVQYTGVVEEHKNTREAVGLFDVSHMGEITVEGSDAFDFLQLVTTNDVSKLENGKAQYSLVLNREGGVIDDLIVYQRAPERFFLCVNASNTQNVAYWLELIRRERFSNSDVAVRDVSNSYAQLAVQGPRAFELLEQLLKKRDLTIASFPAFTFEEFDVQIAGTRFPMLLARTGYTGEDGFEIFLPTEHGTLLWDELLENGKAFSLKPVGLAARDTLRLEVCYPLHGHELKPNLTPVSGGVLWVVKPKKGEFIGKTAIEKAKSNPKTPRLVGCKVTGRGIVREEASIYFEDQEVGVSTSGTKTPSLDFAVFMAHLPKSLSTVGTKVFAEVRGRRIEAEVVSRPFLEKP